MTIRVIVADDQPLMRAAIRACLDAEPDLTVVAEAGDGETAVRLTEQLRPDIVVMDVRMPVMTGIEATRRIVGLTGGRPVRVLVMTTFDVDEHIVDGLRAGASGFLVKDATPDELLGAVRVIARGQAQLSPSVTRRLLDLHGASLPRVDDRAGDGVVAALTPRELAVLKLAARGLPNGEIARALGLASNSVKTYVGHILTKLGLTDRVQLVVFAYEHELIRPGWHTATEARDPQGPNGASAPTGR
ncbi:MAG: response regulator transcription factor [Blastococcus sp.]